ncbi:MAG: DUF1223 domain-containing protein [Candidatus Acidiferrales bacterium]
MRTMIPIAVLAAISFLGIHSLRHVRAAETPESRLASESAPVPVLIELFTSEGCSDCPPADALLEKLDRTQPVNGATLIVLSEHVDYWDDIGWKDPFSSHEYSQRQDAYAVRFGLSSVYTPQMVVDGHFELVGSDESRAIRAIENASKEAKIPVSVSSVHLEGGDIVSLHVHAGQLPSSVAAKSAEILIATADESDESHVKHGENAGRTLKHIAVLRSLTRVGTVDRSGEFNHDVKINITRGNAGNLRLVAIVQDAPVGKVLGVGSAQLSN